MKFHHSFFSSYPPHSPPPPVFPYNSSSLTLYFLLPDLLMFFVCLGQEGFGSSQENRQLNGLTDLFIICSLLGLVS